MKSLMSSSQILDKHTIFDMFFNVTLQWSRWCHLPKSLINILSLICFAESGHLLSYLTSQTSPSMQDCSEKSILSHITYFTIDTRLLWKIHSLKTNQRQYIFILLYIRKAFILIGTYCFSNELLLFVVFMGQSVY